MLGSCSHQGDVDHDVDGGEDGPQRARGHAARLVVDLGPEEDQQGVRGEEEQTCVREPCWVLTSIAMHKCPRASVP